MPKLIKQNKVTEKNRSEIRNVPANEIIYYENQFYALFRE